MTKTRHHYVPIAYQKNFLDEKGYIYKVDLEKAAELDKVITTQSHPNNECYIDHLYRITSEIKAMSPSLAEFDELFIEDYVFNEFENCYQDSIFASLTTEKRVDGSYAKLFAESLIQLKTRNPYYKLTTIENVKNSNHHDLISDLVQKALNDPRFSKVPPQTLYELSSLLDRYYTGHQSYADFLHLLGLIRRKSTPSKLLDEAYSNILNAKWFLLINNHCEVPFIYTDNPGFAYDLKTEIKYNTRFATGFGYFFPLSPKYCIFISDVERDNRYNARKHEKTVTAVNKIESRTVNQINIDFIRFAKSRIFSNSRDYLSTLKPNGGFV